MKIVCTILAHLIFAALTHGYPPAAPPVRGIVCQEPPIAPPVKFFDPFDLAKRKPLPKGVKTCPCSPACVCGCNEGLPCTCKQPQVSITAPTSRVNFNPVGWNRGVSAFVPSSTPAENCSGGR